MSWLFEGHQYSLSLKNTERQIHGSASAHFCRPTGDRIDNYQLFLDLNDSILDWSVYELDSNFWQMYASIDDVYIKDVKEKMDSNGYFIMSYYKNDSAVGASLFLREMPFNFLWNTFLNNVTTGRLKYIFSLDFISFDMSLPSSDSEPRIYVPKLSNFMQGEKPFVGTGVDLTLSKFND